MLIKGTAALRMGWWWRGEGKSSKGEGSMQGKVTQPHEASLLNPQLGNSTSLLALPVLVELARHLASVLIKVGNNLVAAVRKTVVKS